MKTTTLATVILAIFFGAEELRSQDAKEHTVVSDLPDSAIVKPVPYDISIGDMLNIGEGKTGFPIMSLEAFRARNPELVHLEAADVVKEGTVVILVIGE